MNQLLIIFIVLNIVNVILQTAKSIATIRCPPLIAALVNAAAYGLYTVVVVYTVCDLPLWNKVLVVALANLVGVYIVKIVEVRSRKDRIWKIECVVKNENAESAKAECLGLSYNIEPIGATYTRFNFYCYAKKETDIVHDIVKKYDMKYFITETKDF